MKLEELLGEELYKQVAAKIDEKNAGEPDKLKHIRYADLSEGEYVGRGKYDSEIEKLNNIISGKDTELTTANDLIAELKKEQKAMRNCRVKSPAMRDRWHSYSSNLQKPRLRQQLKLHYYLKRLWMLII